MQKDKQSTFKTHGRILIPSIQIHSTPQGSSSLFSTPYLYLSSSTSESWNLTVLTHLLCSITYTKHFRIITSTSPPTTKRFSQEFFADHVTLRLSPTKCVCWKYCIQVSSAKSLFLCTQDVPSLIQRMPCICVYPGLECFKIFLNLILLLNYVRHLHNSKPKLYKK